MKIGSYGQVFEFDFRAVVEIDLELGVIALDHLKPHADIHGLPSRRLRRNVLDHISQDRVCINPFRQYLRYADPPAIAKCESLGVLANLGTIR